MTLAREYKEFMYGEDYPLVSVITPTRRYGPVYEILFNGLKKQTFREFEVRASQTTGRATG